MPDASCGCRRCLFHAVALFGRSFGFNTRGFHSRRGFVSRLALFCAWALFHAVILNEVKEPAVAGVPFTATSPVWD